MPNNEPMRRIIINIPKYSGAGIYKIVNNRTGKVYIGSSCNIRRRIKQHDYAMRVGQCNNKFWEDVTKGDTFRVEILEKVDNMESRGFLHERESYFSDLENSYNEGYNTGCIPLYDYYYNMPIKRGRNHKSENNNVPNIKNEFLEIEEEQSVRVSDFNMLANIFLTDNTTYKYKS